MEGGLEIKVWLLYGQGNHIWRLEGFGIFAVRATQAGRSLIRAHLNRKEEPPKATRRFRRLVLVERQSFIIARQSLAGVSSGCPDSAKSGMARGYRDCDAVSLSGSALASGNWQR